MSNEEIGDHTRQWAEGPANFLLKYGREYIALGRKKSEKSPPPKSHQKKNHEEISTAPIGPDEVSAQWYATARLAIAEMSAWIWGAGQGARRWTTFATRIQEKPAELSLVLMDGILREIDLSTAFGCPFWSLRFLRPCWLLSASFAPPRVHF